MRNEIKFKLAFRNRRIQLKKNPTNYFNDETKDKLKFFSKTLWTIVSVNILHAQTCPCAIFWRNKVRAHQLKYVNLI